MRKKNTAGVNCCGRRQCLPFINPICIRDSLRYESARRWWDWGHNAPRLRWRVAQPFFILLRKSAALPLSSFQSRYHSQTFCIPFGSGTFVRQVPFLTGLPALSASRLSAMVPNPTSPAPANSRPQMFFTPWNNNQRNICKFVRPKFFSL